MAILFQTHLSSYDELCQLSTPRIISASLSLILFCKAVIYVFYFCSVCACMCVRVLADSSGGEVAMTFIKAEAE